ERSAIIAPPHDESPRPPGGARRDLPAPGGGPHVAAGDPARDALAERQRRRAAERVDPRVGGASGPVRAGASVPGEYLLSRERHAGVLRAADRAGAPRRAGR